MTLRDAGRPAARPVTTEVDAGGPRRADRLARPRRLRVDAPRRPHRRDPGSRRGVAGRRRRRRPRRRSRPTTTVAAARAPGAIAVGALPFDPDADRRARRSRPAIVGAGRRSGLGHRDRADSPAPPDVAPARPPPPDAVHGRRRRRLAQRVAHGRCERALADDRTRRRSRRSCSPARSWSRPTTPFDLRASLAVLAVPAARLLSSSRRRRLRRREPRSCSCAARATAVRVPADGRHRAGTDAGRGRGARGVGEGRPRARRRRRRHRRGARRPVCRRAASGPRPTSSALGDRRAPRHADRRGRRLPTAPGGARARPRCSTRRRRSAARPPHAALDAIAALEGSTAAATPAPVGWVDARGDGEWAIALRGAELDGARAPRRVAGAGIVAGSDPDAEWAETAGQARPDAPRARPPLTPGVLERRDRPPRPTRPGGGPRCAARSVRTRTTCTPPAAIAAARPWGRRPPRRSTSCTGEPVIRPPARAEVDRAAASRTASRSARAASACGRNEKIPPPSLSTTTNVSVDARRRRGRAGRCVSCRKHEVADERDGRRVRSERDARARSTRTRRCR